MSLPRRIIGPVGRLDPASTVWGWLNMKTNQAALALNGSLNVAAVTDNGAGDYTVTWDQQAAATPYVVLGLISDEGSALGASTPGGPHVAEGSLLVGSTRILVREISTSGLRDPNLLTIIAAGQR